MWKFALAILLLGLATATNASIRLQRPQSRPHSRQSTSDGTQQEEPHPYTISFFLFPHGATSALFGNGETEKKSNVTVGIKESINKTEPAEANATFSYRPPSDDDVPDTANYQQGSVKHPKSEMFPSCHQCKLNSTYHECIQKKTLQTCKSDLANICYTKSVKRDNIVHYEMGCATHKMCQRARAIPCKLNEKKCFTCCQWSGCNSQSHHHKGFPFAFGRDEETDTKLSFQGDAASNLAPTWLFVFVCASGLLLR
ncbi:uncharacterized protein LOC116614550 isoform X2 [Nematostella vectensis]|uniref:uncharacterized protein LOC116614550 isoform X2 n=1 Tax=Nematostella vectensis TaxID=45351 RepID=UPI0020772531|nr:uncharacterized protein LOC116614550 isoform X2 [Nematostella vectensis]